MTLRLNGATSGYIELDAPAVAGNNAITLPASNGSANQLLKNSGTAGALTWSSITEDSSGNVAVDTNTFYVDAVNNRVGIGSNAPSSNLHVEQNQAGNTQIFLNNTSTAAGSYSTFGITTGAVTGQIYTDAQGNDGLQGMTIRTTTNHALRFGTNNTERVRLDTSGRLLVGTSTAQGVALLQVQGDSASTQNYSQFTLRRGIAASSYTTGGNYIGQINFEDLNGGTYGSIRVETDAACGTNDYPGRLVFSTTADGASSPTERMRIQANGNILFGTQTEYGVGGVTLGSGEIFARRSSLRTMILRRDTTDGDTVEFRRDNTVVGTISVTTTATAYNTSSDHRLKENVVAVTDGISRLQQLKPSRFNFIADPSRTVDGFLAHEVQSVVPEAISGEKDAVDADGNPIYQGIDQSKLVPLLTAALQEAVVRIEQLETAVAALQGS